MTSEEIKTFFSGSIFLAEAWLTFFSRSSEPRSSSSSEPIVRNLRLLRHVRQERHLTKWVRRRRLRHRFEAPAVGLDPALDADS